MTNRKKPKDKRIKRHLLSFNKDHESFLVDKFKEEWLSAEKAMRRHEIVQKAKETGAILVKAVLGLALIGGVVTIASVAPGVFVLLDSARKNKRFFKSDSLPNTLSRTQSKELFLFEQTAEQVYKVTMTDKGKQLILKSIAERVRIKKDKAWDGQWRLVIFDIPRKYNAIRNAIREKMKQIGMKQLQESVLVSPYPCEEEAGFWISVFNASSFVKIITANHITNFNFSLDDF